MLPTAPVRAGVRDALLGMAAMAAAILLMQLALSSAERPPSPLKLLQAFAQNQAPDISGPHHPPVAGSGFWDALPEDALTSASYELTVRLDTERQLIEGRGTITLLNGSLSELDELYFHLYLNAFKNNRTLFERSPFGGGRSGRKTATWGAVDVHSLRAPKLGDADLWNNAAKHSPGDPEDETDIRVPLPAPVQRGGELALDIHWTSKLPEIVERTGFAEDFYMLAQWFPKLAKLNDDGSWAHFAFHPHAEFYADFGNYDVTLDVPEQMKIAASGQSAALKAGVTPAPGRKLLRYTARRVHDFAWAAWPDFEEQSETIEGTAVTLMFPPGHQHNARRTWEALRFALPFFNKNYGPYPYPTLTVVHPPRFASGAGGMEYPTLITTGGPWYASYLARAVESVTIHELGHQWFYGMLANDEPRWPFLDEGLTSYAEARATRALFGTTSVGKLWDLEVSADAFRRAQAASHAESEPIAQPARKFSSFSSLGALVYSRTAVVLRTLERVYGEQKMQQALFDYATSHRTTHPTPESLLRAIRLHLGSEAETQLRRALFDRAIVDYSVESVENAPIKEKAGLFGSASQRQTLTGGVSETRWAGRVLVQRRGSLVLPVEVELETARGDRIREHWDGRGPYKAFEYVGTSPLVAARVDPDQRIPLDQNLLNNCAVTDPRTGDRVWERSSYLVLLFLSWVVS